MIYDGPKMAPRGPKMAPKWPQDAFDKKNHHEFDQMYEKTKFVKMVFS